MEEKISDWLFNFGADSEIVAKAEALEAECERYRSALSTHAALDVLAERQRQIESGERMSTAPELKQSARLTIAGLCEEIKTLTSIDDNRGWEYAAEKMIEMKSIIFRVILEQDAARVCPAIPAIPAIITRRETDEARGV